MDNATKPMLDRSKEFTEFLTFWGLSKPTEGESAPPTLPATASTDDTEDRRYFGIGMEKDTLFHDLYNGNRRTSDESANDQAVMNKLAYWCNHNAALMQEKFLESLHYAQKDEEHIKKCARKDYLDRTTKAAIAGTPVTAKAKDASYKLEQARKDFAPQRPPSAEQPVEVKRTPDGYAPIAPPSALEFISARELWSMDIPPLREIVKGFLPQGLAMIVAPSKYGKSWMCLDLCLSVAAGTPFLCFPTEKTGVLYLALEDGYRRLKGRMNKILAGNEPPDGFDMTIKANSVDNGLTQQINAYIKEKPGTGLIVVDVLQRVRSSKVKGMGAYDMDYQDMGALKNIADTHQICVLVIHHMRKMLDTADPFNMISGTNGLMGAADTIILLHKKTRDAKEATLLMDGRDVRLEGDGLSIEFDGAFTYRWRVIGTMEEQRANNARKEYEADPIVKTIKGLLAENPDGFEMTAGEFAAAMPEYSGEMATPRSIGHSLKARTQQLFNYNKIIFTPGDTKTRKHSFKYQNTTNATNAPNNIIPMHPAEQLTVNPNTYEVTRVPPRQQNYHITISGEKE